MSPKKPKDPALANPRFWLATCELTAPAPGAFPGPILTSKTRKLAIEVLKQGDEWAVLFSKVEDATAPGVLKCLIGFSNSAKACNVWHDRGFPLVDATIRWDPAEETLVVVSPSFHSDSSMRYEERLMAISGIDLDDDLGSGTLATRYEQALLSPDGAQPDRFVSSKAITWQPERLRVRKLPNQPSNVRLNFGDRLARSPSLAPLATGKVQPVRVWTGELSALEKLKPITVSKTLNRGPVTDLFGLPAFRFEDVEVIGFRIDPSDFGGEVESKLAELVAPLNFHLKSAAADRTRLTVPDFRYAHATRTVIIELLRYGRMKSRGPVPPLLDTDSQSQHELVVRLLVGRVDDDTAQARSPAVYVPAIFVDNPWSKILGRDMLGFDKRMAEFCTGGNGACRRLLPDGRLPKADVAAIAANGGNGVSGVLDGPVPLGNITQVRLARITGGNAGAPLLDLSYLSKDHTSDGVLSPIDIDLAFGSSALAGARWRQSDFSAPEFRRSFASLAVAESVASLRSVQVAPVGRRNLEPALVEGRFVVDGDIRFGLPVGVVTLNLHQVAQSPKSSVPSASTAWNLLCQMLSGGSGSARVTLPTGSWYRMRCSMNLTIDDGLSWA